MKHEDVVSTLNSLLLCSLNKINAVRIFNNLSIKEQIDVIVDNNTSVELTLAVLPGVDEFIKSFLAGSVSTPAKVLRVLSSECAQIRGLIAFNRSSPHDVLVKLSSDNNYNIRVSLAQNIATPADILAILSKDESSVVRFYVAINAVNDSILRALSKDDDWEVRLCVATNSSTNIDILSHLQLNDDTDTVRIAAHNNIRGRND